MTVTSVRYPVNHSVSMYQINKKINKQTDNVS